MRYRKMAQKTGEFKGMVSEHFLVPYVHLFYALRNGDLFGSCRSRSKG